MHVEPAVQPAGAALCATHKAKDNCTSPTPPRDAGRQVTGPTGVTPIGEDWRLHPEWEEHRLRGLRGGSGGFCLAGGCRPVASVCVQFTQVQHCAGVPSCTTEVGPKGVCIVCQAHTSLAVSGVG